MPIYSEKVMEHFKNPKNVGEIEDADGIGEVGNPVCGDMMTFYIKVKDNILEDVKFQTFGCGAAIAVSSMVSEMAKSKTLKEVMKITNKIVAEELGGLPPNKMHCSNLGADALHKAIEDYLSKKEKKEKEKKLKEKQILAECCKCPYCEEEITKDVPICQLCKKEFVICPNCNSTLEKGVKICPKCKKEVV